MKSILMEWELFVAYFVYFIRYVYLKSHLGYGMCCVCEV